MTKTASPLDRFEDEYQRYNGLTEARISQQQKTLRAFAEHANKPIEETDAADFAKWMSSLVADGFNPNTVRKKGNMVRPFFTWAFQAGLVSGDVLMAVRRVKNPKGSSGMTDPKPYSAKELKKWRVALDKAYPLGEEYQVKFWKSGRTKSYRKMAEYSNRLQIEAIVGLALYCGLRRAEIFACSVDDMHPDNAYVVVRNGKGGKPREAPHTDRSRELVGAWLEWRDVLLKPHPEARKAAGGRPWLSLAPNQPEPGWLKPMRWARFEVYIATVGEGWGLHRFRHTCATNLLRAGMRLELVSRLMGHASIQQTLCYTKLVNGDVQKAVEKAADNFEDQINGGSE